MNKPLKRVTSLFLMLLMFLTLVSPINLMAASNIGSARILDITYTVLSSGKTIEVARHFVDGQQAWCVDSSKIQLSGVSKTVETLDDYNRLSETVKRKIELIDYYAHQIGAGTSDQIYVTGQFMIWEQTNNIDFNHYSFSNGLNNEEFLNIRKQIQTLIDNHYVIPSFDGTKLEATVGKPITLTDTNGVLEKFVFSSSDTSIATVIQSGNILTITPKASGPVTVSARKIPAEYTGTSLLFSNGDLWQDTAQLKIKDPLRSFLSLEVESLGNLVLGKVDENNESISNTTFDLSRNSNMSEVIGSYTTEENGKVAINDLDAGTYYVQEIWVPSPLILDSNIHKVVVNPAETTTFTATNNLAKGRIEITKTDSDGEKVLSGAVYEVYDSSNRLADTLTTQANGKTISAELPLGTYSIKEIKAPSGYLLSDEVHTVSLVYKDQVTPIVSVSLTLTNEVALGQITITKNGVENEIVAGAKFDIFHASNTKVDTITTGSDGKATSKALPLGDYKLVETFVPAPYLLDSTPISASLLYKDQITAVVTVHVSQKNEVAKGQFSLQKTDAENGDVLADAIFEVSDSDNKLVATLTTDESGKVTSPILPLGKYTVKEVKAPVGFILDNQKYEVELLYVDQLTPLVTTHLDLTNQLIKGKIQIVKINAQDEEVPIPNVVFDVLSLPDRTFIEKITTDQNGFAYTSDLRYGEYLLLEVEAPQEFYLNTNEYTVLIRENEKTEVQYISNDQVLLKLQLQKIDGDSQQPLSDSVWEISNKNTGELVTFEYLDDQYNLVTQTQLTTNSDGLAYTRGLLPYGTYVATEVIAPLGYIRSEPIEFVVDRNTEFVDLGVIGATTSLAVSNYPTMTELRKVDVYGQFVTGAHLQLFDEDTLIAEYISGESNFIIKGLEVGKTYELKEIQAPDGYLLSDPVSITIEETKDVQVLEMINELKPELKTTALFEDGNKHSTTKSYHWSLSLSFRPFLGLFFSVFSLLSSLS